MSEAIADTAIFGEAASHIQVAANC